MSDRDLAITQTIAKAVETLTEEQKDRFLLIAEGAAMMAAAKSERTGEGG